MTITPNLALPYIDAAQAQKHVTHNEAIRGLDALVQTAIVTRTLSAPPAAPADGACYLLAAAGTGLWAGQAAGAVAAWQDASWVFYAPKTGWLVWIVDEAASVTWTGAAWQIPSPPQLGVNATADAANKLSVNSSAVLFNNIGNGIQLKLNKHAVTDTASVLYQDNFSGRAETGLTGDDSYHFKVSPDGATWKEALKIDATSALGTVFGDPAAALGIATKQYVDAHTGLTPPGGGSGQLQFNNAGAFGGFTASGDAAINTSTGAVTITANVVTNAKAAQMPANTFKGNNTAAAANAADLTTAQAKALLAISTADITGLGVLATASTVNLSTQATGTTQAAQEPGHTGDVTNAAGSLALAIANNVVTNAKLAQMPANTLKGNNTAAVANAVDITPSQALDVIGSTRGALTFRGASGWGVLAPGAAGQALTSNGAGADPSYLPVRPQLTSARTYFVATTGSDANTGLAVGTPFLTIQKAIDTVASLDINGQTIIIQVADGTYTGAVSLKNAVGFIGLGSLQLVGNVTTPANCILNVPAGCITASSLACAWDVSGFRLASTAGNALTVNGSVVRIATIDFGACPAGSHMSLSQAGKILSLGNYSMSGAALAHVNAIGQSFVDVSGRTITIAGTPAITTFVIANYLSLVWIFGCTFSGTATGQRYSAGTNGIIYVNGAATTYLPGSTAGATATGGQYV